MVETAVRAIKSMLTILAVLILLIPIALVTLQLTGNSPMPLVDGTINRLPVRLTSAVGLRSSDPVIIGQWPPQIGSEFPDLVLADETGTTRRLSEFAGKIILVEYAAVPCKGCQAFAGGNDRGGYGGVAVQSGLDSIEAYAETYAGVKLGTEDVVFVQVLLYGKSLSAPTAEEVSGWAEHFGMAGNDNKLVLRGDPSMLSQDTYEMIPGFHLLDRNFMLRADSCGHQPKDNLYTDLLPRLGKLAR